MSQYAVEFDEKTTTFTIKDENQHKPNKKAVTHIHVDALGEMSEATVRPMPNEHLANYLRENHGLEYRFATVKNETSNERVEKLVKQGDERREDEKTVQVYTNAETEVTEGETELTRADVELRAPNEA